MSTETEKQPAGQSEPPIVAVPSSDLLGVGAIVTWCHSSSNGRSINFTTRRGTLLHINRENGMGCVKYRSKLLWLPLRRFRSASARTELTEYIAGPESSPNKEMSNSDPDKTS